MVLIIRREPEVIEPKHGAGIDSLGALPSGGENLRCRSLKLDVIEPRRRAGYILMGLNLDLLSDCELGAAEMVDIELVSTGLLMGLVGITGSEPLTHSFFSPPLLFTCPKLFRLPVPPTTAARPPSATAIISGRCCSRQALSSLLPLALSVMAAPSPDIAASTSHPPCRCEYLSSDEEAIKEPGLFDAATYLLPSRRLGYGGFLQYRPPVGGPEAVVVRREPEQHLSILNVPISFLKRNRRLEACGGGKEVHKWFLVLPEQVQELVRAAGFEAFVLGLNLPKMDWSLMTSLVERWWDTTNTFHLPSAGKMTITPGDFSLLTGLRVGRAPLRVDPRLWERVRALEWFLGKVPPLHSRGHVDISWLSKTFMKTDILTQVSVEQLTRAFLLGQTLFANKDGSVHMQFLAPLQHLEVVRDFDWGASGLATLYGNLGACSQNKSPILSAYYRVLELWAFEHLLQFPPETRHGDANCIPRYERWLAGQWKPRSPILSLPEWYGLTLGVVYQRMPHLRVLESWTVLAACLRVPFVEPASMRSTSLMCKEDLKNARIRDWAGLLLQAGDYMEYCRLFLAPAVAAPPVALVWPRAPSFVSFHFDDGEEECLALTPCTIQLYTLPVGASQVPAGVVQEWLHAYQSAEALVRSQRRRILELEAERVPAAGGEGMGASELSPSLSQRSSRKRRHG
ncbi:hypothetical protein RHMOL_Rhmol02G0165400 [Rhododendron molle]|uniref:Uncharacterized protein n=1 Tax=Rhododendron molle TaxID=49168 RepID=A0ACC0PQK1_RHOML|nr:hypothetical protein RHMOL_Rhmol02G0165400 [Rhododendron molle]